MPKAGDLVIDELGNIGILMHNGYIWIGEFDLRATYGVGFVESLPDIANGEMTEIRIKYTAEKCE
jgi:hypothetical protein